MRYFHIPAAILSITVCAVLRWVLVVLPGLFLVPVAILFSQDKLSPVNPGRFIRTAPDWLWLWGNDQEGYIPSWYLQYKGWAKQPYWMLYWHMYVWAAIRNPGNNLRFVRWLNPKAVREKLYYYYGPGIKVLRYKCFYRIMIHTRDGGWGLLAGWKFPFPGDSWQVWQKLGTGFGVRLKRYVL